MSEACSREISRCDRCGASDVHQLATIMSPLNGSVEELFDNIGDDLRRCDHIYCKDCKQKTSLHPKGTCFNRIKPKKKNNNPLGYL